MSLNVKKESLNDLIGEMVILSPPKNHIYDPMFIGQKGIVVRILTGLDIPAEWRDRDFMLKVKFTSHSDFDQQFCFIEDLEFYNPCKMKIRN